MPITMFEQGIVLSGLGRLGLDVEVPKELVADIETILCETGAPGGAGLSPDSDSTAVVLFALACPGAGRRVDCLQSYELETHFCARRGESDPPVNVNAHVQEAFGYHLTDHPVDSSSCESAVRKTSQCLAAYPTVCATLALDSFGGGQSAETVHDAGDWVLATPRADALWGRWRLGHDR